MWSTGSAVRPGSLLDEDLVLREVGEADLPIFVELESNPGARWMAAFGMEEPVDKEKNLEHWKHLLRDDSTLKRTVVVQGQVAGYVIRFELLGKSSVAYWLRNEFWGKGVATRALGEFLRQIELRPIYARVAKDNIASRRVLEKCGFTAYGEEHSYASARQTEIDELLFVLLGS
jgi:RimJ/RimL family protein N-acetyltransferase